MLRGEKLTEKYRALLKALPARRNCTFLYNETKDELLFSDPHSRACFSHIPGEIRNKIAHIARDSVSFGVSITKKAEAQDFFHELATEQKFNPFKPLLPNLLYFPKQGYVVKDLRNVNPALLYEFCIFTRFPDEHTAYFPQYEVMRKAGMPFGPAAFFAHMFDKPGKDGKCWPMNSPGHTVYDVHTWTNAEQFILGKPRIIGKPIGESGWHRPAKGYQSIWFADDKVLDYEYGVGRFNHCPAMQAETPVAIIKRFKAIMKGAKT